MSTTVTKKNIKALLVFADIKQIDIARRLGVTRALVSSVVSGRRSSPRVRRAIARALRMSVEELWPKQDERVMRGSVSKAHGKVKGKTKRPRKEAV